MAKPAVVVQQGAESPSGFYEILCEAYRLYDTEAGAPTSL